MEHMMLYNKQELQTERGIAHRIGQREEVSVLESTVRGVVKSSNEDR